MRLYGWMTVAILATGCASTNAAVPTSSAARADRTAPHGAETSATESSMSQQRPGTSFTAFDRNDRTARYAALPEHPLHERRR
jgi:hypothetical protein